MKNLKSFFTILFAFFVAFSAYSQKEIQKTEQKTNDVKSGESENILQTTTTGKEETKEKPAKQTIEKPTIIQKGNNGNKNEQTGSDFIETKESGFINWTQGYLEVDGVAFYNQERFAKNDEKEKEITKRGAYANARNNILKALPEVKMFDTLVLRDGEVFKQLEYQITEGVVKGIATTTVGEPVYGEKSVKVKMRYNLHGEMGVGNLLADNPTVKSMLQQAGVEELPTLEQAEQMKQQLITSDPELAQVFNDSIKIQVNNAAGDYTPGLIPTVTVKCLDGKERRFNLNKYTKMKSANSQKALTVVNTTRDILNILDVNTGVPILDGVIKNNELNVDLCAELMKYKKEERAYKWINGIQKAGEVAMTLLPLLALF